MTLELRKNVSVIIYLYPDSDHHSHALVLTHSAPRSLQAAIIDLRRIAALSGLAGGTEMVLPGT